MKRRHKAPLGVLAVRAVVSGCVPVIHEQKAAYYPKGHGEEIKLIARDALARAEPGTPEAKRWELVAFHVEPVIAWPKATLRLKGAPRDLPDIPRTPEDVEAVKAEEDALEDYGEAIDEAQSASGAGGILGWILGAVGVAGGGGIGGLLLRMFTKHRSKIQQLAGQLLRKDRALDEYDTALEEAVTSKERRRKLGAVRPAMSTEHDARKPPA
ncbi:MAG: hypothetical protein ACYTKD_23560 [Planctomycetota bacterium]|jgi:hypothetical protein